MLFGFAVISSALCHDQRQKPAVNIYIQKQISINGTENLLEAAALYQAIPLNDPNFQDIDFIGISDVCVTKIIW